MNVVKSMQSRRTFHHLLIWLVVSAPAVVGMLLLRAPVAAQVEPSTQAENQPEEISYDRQRALGIVEYMAELIPTLPQPAHRVLSGALVGEILWPYDPARARDYFRTAFSTINRVQADDSPEQNVQPEAQRWTQEKRHQLRLEVLRRVTRLDQQLERELINQLKKEPADAASGSEGLSSQELIELASLLLEDDPAEAVNVAEASLDQGVSPEFGSFLAGLRETDPESANQLFTTALGTITEEPETNMDGLLSLLNYAFPQGAEGAGSGNSAVSPAQTTQLLDALASGLRQPEAAPSASPETPSGSELSPAERAALIQQHLPLFEQHAPETVPALQSASHHLSTQGPPVSVQPTSAQATESEPTESLTNPIAGPAPVADQRTRDRRLGQAAISAAHHGDAHQAEQLLRRIQDRQLRQEARDLVHLEIAFQAIAEDDFPRARQQALGISQVKQRAAVHIRAAEKLDRQGETDRAAFWLHEAYDFTARLDDSPEKAWTLFRLVDAALRLDSPRAFEMAQLVVGTVNRIRHQIKATSLTTALEQSSLEDYLTQTFDRLGRADYDRALYLAMQLQSPEARILAELAVCRVVLAPDANRS